MDLLGKRSLTTELKRSRKQLSKKILSTLRKFIVKDYRVCNTNLARSKSVVAQKLKEVKSMT